jgi:hypothetical protein
MNLKLSRKEWNEVEKGLNLLAARYEKNRNYSLELIVDNLDNDNFALDHHRKQVDDLGDKVMLVTDIKERMFDWWQDTQN